ncbi:hypothetical protein L596_005778 [Steinernema carpocapsae]|uniref:Uncharacterized protein n=1 Tax=Steinernema carpocapsae TaxID=34508 RepID=A0A4U8V4J4_STECR|nr:hypothetical protein L596_005778 [Steinernema carpocapsae]
MTNVCIFTKADQTNTHQKCVATMAQTPSKHLPLGAYKSCFAFSSHRFVVSLVMWLESSFLIVYLLCGAFSGNVGSKMRDCVKPWQRVLKTIETVSRPSMAVQCHPDSNPCSGEAECQFSFRQFKYVCCEDRDDVRAPLCPKFHDTLKTICGKNGDAQCPPGYSCLGSRFDMNLRICCRPNRRLKYPEPATGFNDHYITPELIPTAPDEEVQISFHDFTLASGQMVPKDKFKKLENPPHLSGFNGREESLYTVVLFDKMVEYPVELLWFVSDVRFFNESLEFTTGQKRAERHVVEYQVPKEDSAPGGVHVLVLVIFEQKEQWNGKRWPVVDKVHFDVKQWIASAREFIEPIPVAGNFYGFRSTSAKNGTRSSYYQYS